MEEWLAWLDRLVASKGQAFASSFIEVDTNCDLNTQPIGSCAGVIVALQQALNRSASHLRAQDLVPQPNSWHSHPDPVLSLIHYPEPCDM